MTDIVSRKKRSEMMSGIRGKDTKPELLIRHALFARGYRYRIHTKGIPGKPDLTLRRYKAAIFIHGCFWHMHNCNLFKWPSSRPEFWRNKLTGNAQRDLGNIDALHKAGWRTCIVWECAIKGKSRLPLDAVIDKLDLWLKGGDHSLEVRGNS
ncbi:MAG: DNA mismatch endonuclease Vsr [Oceanospirillaceae bacterium]|nr:DNA mismatch endonuclease Vsr [Oceanospirillaceae bacterium]